MKANKKLNLSNIKADVFYKHIYPLYPKEFLLWNKYEDFAKLVAANFILNSQQWEYILEHWEDKENIIGVQEDETIKHVDLTPLMSEKERESFELIYSLKKCIERLTSDNALTQFDKDQEAEWIGQAHEYLHKINPNYYKNANS